jgi:hypothetical protein
MSLVACAIFDYDAAAGSPSFHDSALSNDYLNHYNEPLMLIELAGQDPTFWSDLETWQPMSYLAYFQASPLRRAPAAIEAYLALSYEQRCAFEAITDVMDRLILAAIASFRHDDGAESATFIADITLPALRCLIEEAGNFLNSGGDVICLNTDRGVVQDTIDRLMERGQ